MAKGCLLLFGWSNEKEFSRAITNQIDVLTTSLDVVYGDQDLPEEVRLSDEMKEEEMNDFFKSLSDGMYINNLLKGARLRPGDADSDEAVAEVNRRVYAALELKVRNLKVNGTLENDVELLNKIATCIGLSDDTLDAEKAVDDVFTGKGNELDKAMYDLYGNGYATVLDDISGLYLDNMVSAAWVDIETGRSVDGSLEGLNTRIWRYKARLFQEMVQYMKNAFPDDEEVKSVNDELFFGQRENSFFTDESFELYDNEDEDEDYDPHVDITNYNKAMRLFEEKIAKRKGFGNEVIRALADNMGNSVSLELEARYEALFDALRQQRSFVNFMSRNGFRAKSDLDDASTKPFSGKLMSAGAKLVSDFISDTDYAEAVKAANDLLGEDDSAEDIIASVRRFGVNHFLSAAESYTILSNFDSLLSKVMKGELKIVGAHKGSMKFARNMYRMGNDLSHFNTSWQGQDYIGSEKYTPARVELILQTIRVNDWRNPTVSENKRIKPSEYNAAFSALLDEIRHNSTFFVGPMISSRVSNAIRDAINEAKDCAWRFRDNPVRNLKRILDLLFSAQEVDKARFALIRYASTAKLDTKQWSIIKSFYEKVFSKNENSFISNAIDEVDAHKGSSMSDLVSSLAAYIDNNHTRTEMEFTYNRALGTYEPTERKAVTSAAKRKATRTRVNNYINNMDSASRANLSKTYSFTQGTESYTVEKFGRKMEGKLNVFSATLANGETIKLSVDANSVLQLFVGDSTDSTTRENINHGQSLFVVPEGYFESMNLREIDFQKLQKLFEAKKNFTTVLNDDSVNIGESRLLSLMKLIDDTLGLGLLGNPSYGLELMRIYMERFDNVGLIHISHFAQPFLKYAFRGLYANDVYSAKYNSARDTTLADYLKSKGDHLYLYYNADNYRIKRRFIKVQNDLNYAIVSHYDGAFDTYIDSVAVINGELSRTTVMDGNGNPIPVATVNSPAVEVEHDMQSLRAPSGQERYPIQRTAFSNHPELIKGIYNVGAVKEAYGDKFVKVNDMSKREQILKSILLDFYVPLFTQSMPGNVMSGGYILVVPTDYSDAATTVGYAVNPFNARMPGVMGSENDKSAFKRKTNRVRQIISTMGSYYKSVAEASEQRLRRVLTEFAKPADGDSAELSARKKMIRKALERADGVYGAGGALAMINESELVSTAGRIGAVVYRNFDYRKYRRAEGQGRINGLDEYRLVGNALMTDYADYFGDETDVHSGNNKLMNLMLKSEKSFLASMLSCDLRLQFITSKADKLTNWKSGSENAKYRSSNQVTYVVKNYISKLNITASVATELEHYVLGEKDKNGNVKSYGWVDTDGALILARSGKNGEKVIKTMLDFNPDEDIILNPILETYMYNTILLSHNLKIFVNGSDLSCADGGMKNPFYAMKKAVESNITPEQFNALGYGRFDDKQYAVSSYNALREIVRRCETPHDLVLEVRRLESLKRKTDVQKDLLDILSRIRERSFESSSRYAMNDNGKRAQGAIGTRVRVQQGDIYGLPYELNMAFIDDLMANVTNPRGEDAEIEATEGSGMFTAEASILFNHSAQMNEDNNDGLTSEIKKPVWRVITPDGVAFYGKFASHVYNNESMIRTSHSKVSHYNLYKKLNNIQWSPDDKIDLTNSSYGTIYDDEYSIWENVSGGENVYYLRKNNEMYAISNFKKSESAGRIMYYTIESAFKPFSEEAAGERAVYHIFYDATDSNGRKVRSLHRRVTGSTQREALSNAKRVMEELESKGQNPHTINSLFELFEALGGMYNVDINGRISEKNHYVIVNFMNLIGKRADHKHTDLLDQSNVDQILKRKFIAGIMPPSSAKVLKPNINPEASWWNDEDLAYAPIKTDGLGIQLNPEKNIIGEDLAEPTQMIAACLAYGYTFDRQSELLRSIGKSIAHASASLVKATNSFLNEIDESKRLAAKNEIYDFLGRIAVESRYKKGTATLMDVVLNRLKDIFYRYKNHENSKNKVPFSASGIYRQFSIDLANQLTNEAIKRRFPGSSSVIVPAYKQMQLFEIVDRNGKVEKLLARDVIKRAQKNYRNDLVKFFQGLSDYDPQEGSVSVKGKRLFNGMNIEYVSTAELEREALKIKPDGSFSEYYTAEQDTRLANAHLFETYVRHNSGNAQYYKPKSWFMPSDVLEVVDSGGNVLEVIDLDSLKAYYSFKNTDFSKKYGSEVRYRTSLGSPRDLRPSTLRWQYRTADGRTEYMNWFDLPHVRNAYRNGIELDSPAYRRASRAAYLLLKNGQFNLNENDKNPTDMIEGSFEEDVAEAVISNFNAAKFGIRVGDSLADVLARGPRYFMEDEGKMVVPFNPSDEKGRYDIVLLRGDRRHMRIRFGPMDESQEGLRKEEFKGEDLRVNENGEVVYSKNGYDCFVVAKWVDDPDVVYNDARNRFETKDGREVDQSLYRNGDPGKPVQRKVTLVTPYRLSSLSRAKATQKDVEYGMPYYSVADLDTFYEAYGNPNDARRAFENIISNMFVSGEYKLAQISQDVSLSDSTKKTQVSIALDKIAQTLESDRKKANALNAVVKMRGLVDKWNNNTWNEYVGYKNKVVEELAHDKWVSFLDSLKILSSRIPAQSMQSFMAMKVVGWTESENNIAYVSHFQAYLQGSDYDVDKANILGQSYDTSGVLQGWSPYFDYGSLETLEASKLLPVPKGMEIREAATTAERENAADITNELTDIIAASDLNDPNTSELAQRLIATGLSTKRPVTLVHKAGLEDRARFVAALASALMKIENSGGLFVYNANSLRKSLRVSFTGEALTERISAAVNTMQDHENYVLSPANEDGAYKNSIFSNVWEISTDVMNRDASWQEVNTKELTAAAEKYGSKDDWLLTPLNPLAPVLVSYNAHVGKNLVGHTATAIKFLFNYYHYYNRMLRSGKKEDIDELRFNITTSFIEGRSKGNSYAYSLGEKTIDHLPDLNMDDEKIKRGLRILLGSVPENEYMAHMDEKESGLLNAAADNGKNPILGKINATTEYIKMYTQLALLGFETDDVVAFMTSPYVDMLVNHTGSNVISSGLNSFYAKEAIDFTGGLVKSGLFLHGKYVAKRKYQNGYEDESFVDDLQDYADEYSYRRVNDQTKADDVKTLIDAYYLYKGDDNKKPNALDHAIRKRHGISDDVVSLYSVMDLDELVQAIMIELAIDPDIIGHEIHEEGSNKFIDALSSMSDDAEVVAYARTLDSLVEEMRYAAQVYTADMEGMDPVERRRIGMEYFIADYNNFKYIYYIANETSKIGSSALSLNQGIKVDENELIGLFTEMSKVVKDREKYLQIYDWNIFDKYHSIATEDLKYRDERNKLIKRLKELNSHLSEDDIFKILYDAHTLGIINNFNIKEAMNDKSGDPTKYRAVSKAYIGLIKGMTNIVSMIYNLPNYAEMIDLLAAYENARTNSVVKSRVLDEMVKENVYINRYDPKRTLEILNYIDSVVALDYLAETDTVVLEKAVEAFGDNFEWAMTDTFDLDTKEGSAGFRYFMQTEFFQWLRVNHSDNGFVQGLTFDTVNGRSALVPRIDMTHYDQNAESLSEYLKMIVGLSELQDIENPYSKKYSIADFFVLYNILTSYGMQTRTSMTDLFVMIEGKSRVLNDYMQKTGEKDSDADYIPKWSKDDLEITLAPEVNSNTIKNNRHEYVKLTGDTNGFDLMHRNNKLNSYEKSTLFDALFTDEDATQKELNSRKRNFNLYCPFQFPKVLGNLEARQLIAYDIEVNEKNRKSIKSRMTHFLLGQSQAGKIAFAIKQDGKKEKGGTRYNIFLVRAVDDENDKRVLDYSNIGSVRIGQNDNPDEKISFDTISELIMNLNYEERSSIADMIATAKKAMSIKKDDIALWHFVSNITVDGLMKKYYFDNKRYPIDKDAGTGYNIIFSDKFTLGGKSYSGRVIDGDGRALYIMKNKNEARRFMRYLMAKQTLVKADREKGGLSGALKKNDFYISREEDINQIMKHYKKGSVRDMLFDFLDNAQNYKPFNYKTKSTSEYNYGERVERHVNPQAVLGELLDIFAGDYYVEKYAGLHDEELEMWGLRNKGGSYAEFKITRSKLYNFFRSIDDNFDETFTKEDFLLADKEELNNYISDFSSRRGFDWMRGLEVTDLTFAVEEKTESQTESGEKVRKVENRLSLDYIEKNWEDVYASATRKKKGVTRKTRQSFPATFSKFRALSAEEKAKFINAAELKIPYMLDGNQRNAALVCEIVRRKDGKESVRLKYVTEEKVTEKKKVSNQGSYVVFNDSFSNAEKEFGISYNTESYMKPANRTVKGYGDIVKGVYKGFFIYEGKDEKGVRRIGVSRNIQGPYNYIRPFDSFESALEYIEQQNSNNTLDGFTLLELHMKDGRIRDSVIRSESVRLKQNLTIKDVKLREWDYNEIPLSVRHFMNYYTADEAADILSDCGIKGLKRLHTPEELMLLTMRISEELYYWSGRKPYPKTENEFFDDIKEYVKNHAEDVNSIISTIENAPYVTYVVEKLDRTKKYGRLRYLMRNGDSLNVDGVTVGNFEDNVTIKEYLDGPLNDAVEIFKKRYKGLEINVMTEMEMLDTKELVDNLKLNKDNIKSVRAFIYNGKIYINSSRADAGDPSHEVVHILLGAMKANDYDLYVKTLGELARGKEFSRKRRALESKYPYMASQDLDEEAVAAVLADEVRKSVDLYIEYDSEENPTIKNAATFLKDKFDLIGTIEGITNVLKKLYGKEKTNGLEFDDWVMQSFGNSARYRKTTNLIQTLIEKGNGTDGKGKRNAIIEECD